MANPRTGANVNDRVFIGLGSNIGDRIQFLQKGIAALEAIPKTHVVAASSVYETEPVGLKEQPPFLNAVVEVQISLGPVELVKTLKAIEEQIGRTESVRWGPREVDLDLLYYGEKVLHKGRFIIPHPEIAKRKFVLVPLAEIAADFVDPSRALTIGELLSQCVDTSGVIKTQYNLEHHQTES